MVCFQVLLIAILSALYLHVGSKYQIVWMYVDKFFNFFDHVYIVSLEHML